ASTAIANEHGLSFWQATGLVMRGWALSEQGELTSGIAMLRQGLTAFVPTGGKAHWTYHLALLAEALGREGHFEEGLDLLAKALTRWQDRGEGFHAAEPHRLQGEFLLRQGASEAACHKAEASFLRSLTSARRQQAKSLELRAAMSLARLYQ